jgi:signal recognition particle subunit SRP72
MSAQHPGEPRTVLLQACVLAGRGDIASADSLLAASGEDARLALLRAQLAANTGDTSRVAALLASLPEPVASSSRVIATRSALLEARGDAEAAEALLDEAVACNGDSNGGASLLLASARAKAEHGRISEAVSIYQRLLCVATEEEASRRALRGLVAVLMEVDLDQAEALAEQLSAPSRPTDAEELDSSPNLGAVRAEAATPAVPEVRLRKKARRKPRYPPGFDPTATNNPPPDPERWLPRRERAAAKRKNKKNVSSLRGSQGAAPLPPSAAAPQPHAKTKRGSK